jgi:hypothetical protein
LQILIIKTDGIANPINAEQDSNGVKQSCNRETPPHVYDKYWDNISTEKSMLSASFRDGEAKRKTEGERNKTVQVIVKGHKAEMSVDNLSSITDLTPDQVTAILKEEGLL